MIFFMGIAFKASFVESSSRFADVLGDSKLLLTDSSPSFSTQKNIVDRGFSILYS